MLDADREAAADVILAAFADPTRYGRERLVEQLAPAAMPFYRRFFVARRQGELVGVGGIKAADWASDTHILYLDAVAEHARGRARAQHVRVVDVRSAGAQRVHQRQRLAPRSSAADAAGKSHGRVDHRFQIEALRQRRDQQQPRVRDQVRVIEGRVYPVQPLRYSRHWKCLLGCRTIKA